jgi:hypothetical protein
VEHVSKSTEARELLLDLQKLLEEQRESNWIRGIKLAVSALSNADGSVAENGFEDARSTYRSMTAGGRGFSEYNVWDGNQERSRVANERLSALKEKLWRIFDS